MELVGRGNERIRATHAKTLELTADARISERATCVIAVETQPPTDRIAGPVRVTIRAGDESFGFDAHANSSWDPAGPAVIRRGPLRLPGTLATHASAAAADLPPALVARLRDPSTVVTVALVPRPSAPCLVLFAADPAFADDPRLAAEVAAADTVVAADAGAARLLGRTAAAPAEITGRTLLVATGALPGRGLMGGDAAVETVGLLPEVAAALAAPWAGPVLLATAQPPLDALRGAPADCRLVLATDRRGLATLLRQAHEIRGSSHAVVARDYADPVFVAVDDPGEFPGADRLFVCPGPGDTD
ncbi:MAG TPA: DUF371 domain-containing protein, partial [Jatrophihabitans sp.]|nr:DUF371 domain-containing protein [Jatrophihabitans sp.]